MYALLSLAASYICFPLGILVYQRDPKNTLNKMFMLSCVLLGGLAFTEFGLRQAANATTAITWIKASAFWPFSLAVYLHFILIFIKSRALNSNIIYFLLYIPALVITVLTITTPLVSGPPEREYWGWMYSAPEPPTIYNITFLWAFFMRVITLVFVFLYFHTQESIERQRAKYVLAAMIIPVVVTSLVEGILPLMDITFPNLAIIASISEHSIITYGIYKYNIFELTPAVAADNIVAAMSNMLFLTRKEGDITLANEHALTLLGYSERELIGQPLSTLFAEKDRKTIQKSNALKKNIINEEMEIITKDKRLIPVLVSVSVVYDKMKNNLGMVCIGSDLTDHNRAKDSERKEVLLKEIHHRVKNNMQIISSLLNLQSRYINHEKYKEMFKDCENRIRSMALLHEKLYQSKDLENINAHEYITNIVNGLAHSYGGQHIVWNVKVDNISIGINTAVPCGLIISELVSNALKYAFPDKKGEITVRFNAVNNSINLVIADDGVGIPDTINFRTTETLGLRLVTILAEDQLNGEITLVKNKGTEFCITFQN